MTTIFPSSRPYISSSPLWLITRPNVSCAPKTNIFYDSQGSLHAKICYFACRLLFKNFNMLFCSACSHLIVSSLSPETKEIANEARLASVLKHDKISSFVLKWKRVVSMLSPLASKSCGGSQIHIGLQGLP